MVERHIDSAGTFAHLFITQWGAKIFAQEPIREKLNVYGLHFSFEIEIAFRGAEV